MNDLISRQAALDGIEQFRPIEPKHGETSMEAVNRSAWNCAINCAETFIRTMPPSAQPDVTDINVGDTISRQDAIRWVKTECNPYGKPTLEFESGKKVIEHLEQMPSAQPKKKLLFSDRQEIVKEYKRWCLINNVDGCEASFLAYLIIKGFIDG